MAMAYVTGVIALAALSTVILLFIIILVIAAKYVMLTKGVLDLYRLRGERPKPGTLNPNG